jgi:hypothetical protein
MSMFKQVVRSEISAACACVAFVTAALLSTAACAQGADAPTKPHDSKVLNGIGRGADAAGRGIGRASDATRRGVDHTAERASAPIRRWGEALGRKLSPHSAKTTASSGVGPQGNAP